jgi:hypothetical protein
MSKVAIVYYGFVIPKNKCVKKKLDSQFSKLRATKISPLVKM